MNPGTPSDRFRLLLSLCLLCLCLVTFHRSFLRTPASDFFLVWANAMYFNEGNRSSNLYDAEHKENVMRFLLSGDFRKDDFFSQNIRMRPDLNICATPFFLSSFYTLVKHPCFSESRFLYGLLSLAGFLFGLILLMNRVLKIRPDIALSTAVLFLFFYHPIAVSIQLGNVNEPLILFIALLHVFQGDSTPAAALLEGVLLAILLLLKPFFLASSVLLLFDHAIRKRGKTFFYGFVFTLIAGWLVSSMILGFSSWGDWFHYLRSLDIAYWAESIKWGNMSLSACVFNEYSIDPGLLLFVLLTILSLAGIFRFRHRDTGPLFSMGLFWTGFFIFTFSSPLFWYHYHALNAIPLVFLISFSLRKKTAFARNAYACLFFVLFIVIGLFTSLFPMARPVDFSTLVVLFSGNFLLAFLFARETFFPDESSRSFSSGPDHGTPT